MEPELIADLSLYDSDGSRRRGPILDRFRCPCFVQKDTAPGGWDCLVLLGEAPLALGETRRVRFLFMSGQKAIEVMRQAGRFYLWELGFIGEAVVVDPKP